MVTCKLIFCVVFNDLLLGELVEKKKTISRLWNTYGCRDYSCEKPPAWPVCKN